MQVNPSRSIGRVIAGLALLRQSGYDTKGHLLASALTIQDGLIFGKTDSLGQHLDDPGGEVYIVILQQGITNRNITGNLEAVKSDLVKAECQLIDGTAHFSPNGLGDSTGNGLTGFAIDIADADPTHQFGVAIHILCNEVEEYNGDGQLAAGNISLAAGSVTQLRKEGLHIGLGYDSITLFFGESVKGTYIHGEGANVDSVHCKIIPFVFLFGFRLALGFGLVFLCVFEVFLKPLDLCGEFLLFFVVSSFFLGVFLQGFLYGLLLILGLCFTDCLFDFCGAGFKLGILRHELAKRRTLHLKFLCDHNCFQCHRQHSFLFSFLMVSFLHCSSLRPLIFSRSFFLASTIVSS